MGLLLMRPAPMAALVAKLTTIERCLICGTVRGQRGRSTQFGNGTCRPGGHYYLSELDARCAVCWQTGGRHWTVPHVNRRQSQ